MIQKAAYCGWNTKLNNDTSFSNSFKSYRKNKVYTFVNKMNLRSLVENVFAHTNSHLFIIIVYRSIIMKYILWISNIYFVTR